MIVTDQGPPLPDKYMQLLTFLGQSMKDREAVEVVYKLQPFIENVQDNDKLVAILEDLR